MKITVINGTNRVGNHTQKISGEVVTLAKELQHDVSYISLENWTELFRGTHINFTNASAAQLLDLKALESAQVVLFVTPTYHSGIPSPLKNFLDTVKQPGIYEHKVFGLIAGSDKNQDLGARQLQQILNGIFSYNKAHAFVAPRMNISTFVDIDTERLKSFIEFVTAFVKN